MVSVSGGEQFPAKEKHLIAGNCGCLVAWRFWCVLYWMDIVLIRCMYGVRSEPTEYMELGPDRLTG